jgi:hypothetical protein
MPSESAMLKQRRQEMRRATYLRETGRGVTLVPQKTPRAERREVRASETRLSPVERAARWEGLLRMARSARMIA